MDELFASFAFEGAGQIDLFALAFQPQPDSDIRVKQEQAAQNNESPVMMSDESDHDTSQQKKVKSKTPQVKKEFELDDGNLSSASLEVAQKQERKRKVAARSAAASTTTEKAVEQSNADGKPQKRPRGRPRKNQQSAAGSSSSASKSSKTSTKRNSSTRSSSSSAEANTAGKTFDPSQGVDLDSITRPQTARPVHKLQILSIADMKIKYPTNCDSLLTTNPIPASNADTKAESTPKQDSDGDITMNASSSAAPASNPTRRKPGLAKKHRKKKKKDGGSNQEGREDEGDDDDEEDDEWSTLLDATAVPEQTPATGESTSSSSSSAAAGSIPSWMRRIENPLAQPAMADILNTLLQKDLPRYQPVLQMSNDYVSNEVETRKALLDGRTSLLSFTVEHENLLLWQAGEFRLSANNPRKIYFPPCKRGENCVGRTPADLEGKKRGFALKGKPGQRVEFTLMAFLYPNEYKNVIAGDKMPVAVKTRACILCTRFLVQNAVLGLGSVHSRSGQQVDRKMATPFSAEMLDPSFIVQPYDNPLDNTNGYYSEDCLRPNDAEGSHLLGPIAMFQRDKLLAEFDSTVQRFRVNQDCIVFKPSPVEQPFVGEKFRDF